MRSAVAIVVALGLSATAGLAASTTSPHLRIVAHAPLGLRGDGFQVGEQVTLSVRLGQARLKRLVRTSAHGSFTAVFAKLRLDGCRPLHVEATGAKGDRASFALETTLGCSNHSTN